MEVVSETDDVWEALQRLGDGCLTDDPLVQQLLALRAAGSGETQGD